jgi:hypothetical protein
MWPSGARTSYFAIPDTHILGERAERKKAMGTSDKSYLFNIYFSIDYIL